MQTYFGFCMHIQIILSVCEHCDFITKQLFPRALRPTPRARVAAPELDNALLHRSNGIEFIE